MDVIKTILFMSCFLYGSYAFIKLEKTKYNSEKYSKIILNIYFLCLIVKALRNPFSEMLELVLPSSCTIPYHLHFEKGTDERAKELFCYRFTSCDVCGLISSSILTILYMVNGHWILNNVIAIGMALDYLEIVHFKDTLTGIMFLAGLLVYDVFFVFATDVMQTVATAIDAPVKLIFPLDIFINGFGASEFALIGLGDVASPGLFIAMMLRLDKTLERGENRYFEATLTAYILGLITTFMIMLWFQHGQPALLYLVPACLGTPFALAVARGDVKTLLEYKTQLSELVKPVSCKSVKNE